jgi:hypothetical protein
MKIVLAAEAAFKCADGIVSSLLKASVAPLFSNVCQGYVRLAALLAQQNPACISAITFS